MGASRRPILLLVLLAACLGIFFCLLSCSAPQNNYQDNHISDANVYDKEFSLEWPVPQPQNGPDSTAVNFTLLDCVASKKVPDGVPVDAFHLDPDDARLCGYSVDNQGALSEGFHYVCIRLNIDNPSDKELVMEYSAGAIVSGLDDVDESPASLASNRPVWYNLGIGKETSKSYWRGILKTEQSQEATVVYVVSDAVLQARQGPYLMIDSTKAKKAFRLNLENMKSAS